MIDRDELYNRCASAVRLIVGNRLGQAPDGASGTRPAIFKSKSKFPAGIYPYVLIQIGTRTKQTDWSVYKNTVANGDTTIYTVYDYLVTFNVYSHEGGEEAAQISEDLESAFSRPDVIEIFEVDGFGTPSQTFMGSNSEYRENNQVKTFSNFIVKVTITNEETYSEYEILTVDADLSARYPNSDVDIATTNFIETK